MAIEWLAKESIQSEDIPEGHLTEEGGEEINYIVAAKPLGGSLGLNPPILPSFPIEGMVVFAFAVAKTSDGVVVLFLLLLLPSCALSWPNVG